MADNANQMRESPVRYRVPERGRKRGGITPQQLRGPGRERALGELRVVLVRGLTAALGPNVPAAAIEDFVQEALIKILDNLDSFRGESRFTTWAQKVAVRVAYTELRRARWRDFSLEEMLDRRPEGGPARGAAMADPGATTEQSVSWKMMLEDVGRFVEEELTERQRRALIAATVAGAPLEEVARRMDTNRNALYKLLHDARRKLKKRLEAEGFQLDETLAGLDEESARPSSLAPNITTGSNGPTDHVPVERDEHPAYIPFYSLATTKAARKETAPGVHRTRS